MSRGLPAHVVAAIDQHQAQLAELFGWVREHAATGKCEYPATCPGDVAAAALYRMGPQARYRLLYLALAELAARGYGLRPAQPAAPVEPVVEPTTARRWWWPWRR